jgi:hypothetical protein
MSQRIVFDAPLTTQMVDDDGNTRTLVHVYDETGSPVASVLFKGRDEMPRYSLLRGMQPVRVLGEQPGQSRTADTPDTSVVAAWNPAREGYGNPHYVVSTTPAGLTALAAALCGDADLAARAEAMERGVYDEQARDIVDVFAAVTLFDPTRNEEARALIAHVRAEIGALHDDYQLRIAEIERTHLGDPDAQYRARQQLDIDYRNRLLGTSYDLERNPLATLRQQMPALRSPDTVRVDDLMTVVRALTGDADARNTAFQHLEAMRLAHAAQEIVRDARQAALATMAGRSFHHGSGNGRSADIASIAVVHCTNYEPQRAGDEVLIGARLSHTGYPRATVHFSLNHAVESHMYGSWTGTPYVVVAPLAGAIERSGLPENLHGVDTWWKLDLGQSVRLPGAHVIRFDPAANDLIARDGNEWVVKSANHSAAELGCLVDAGALDKQAIDLDVIRQQIGDAFLQTSPGLDVRTQQAALATALKTYAVGTVLRECNMSLTTGGMRATEREYSFEMLARERGVGHHMHDASTSMAVEQGMVTWESDVVDLRTAAVGGMVQPATTRVISKSMEAAAFDCGLG